MTVAAAEVAPPEVPTITGPDETLVILLPGEVEERIRRLVRQCQAPLADVAGSWLAAGPEDAPVPAGSSAGMSIAVPAHIARAVRAEATRRGLQVGQVASARLSSVAERS